MHKKRRKLQLGLNKIIALTFTMCFIASITACNSEKPEEVYTDMPTEENAVESVLRPKLSALTFNPVTRVSETYMYDILYTDADEITLSAEDIVLPSDFKATVSVLTDSTDDTRRSLMFSGIEAEQGTYEIAVKEGTATLGTEKAEGYTFNIEVISDDLSPYGYTVYSTSAKVVTDDIFTATVTVEGVLDGKFVRSSMSADALKLHNCTADISIKKLNGGLSYCIILTGITVTDLSQPCYLEIPTGILKDVEGSAFSGAKLEFTLQTE